MFGYIKPVTEALGCEEKKLYSAAYCGLCVNGRKKLSRFMSFLLNYDFVVLALIRIAINNELLTFEQRLCGYKCKKKNVLVNSESLDYTCFSFAILIYYKLLDDINDLKGIKKLPKLMCLPYIRHIKRKALRLCPGIDELISKPLAQLTELEKSGVASLDSTADCFARITANIVSFGIGGEAEEKAYYAGYHIGRYVYIIDAADDLEDDMKTLSFNALVSHFGTGEAAVENAVMIEKTLDDSMICASNIMFELCRCNVLSSLLQNIILDGSAQCRKKISIFEVKNGKSV